MAKQKVTVQCTGEYNFTYDPKSKAFQASLKAYSETIDRRGGARSMLAHVAFHINRFDAETMVDGVGYVQVKGKPKPEEPFSGITIEEAEPDFEFDVQGL